MTIEQAITVLRGMETYMCSGNPIWRTDLIKESINMACEALVQADTPQTDLVKESDDVVNDLVKDTPQTEICDTCKYRSSNVFGNWCVGRDTCDRYEADTPRLEITREEAEKIAEQIKAVPLKLERLTDCGWGEPND